MSADFPGNSGAKQANKWKAEKACDRSVVFKSMQRSVLFAQFLSAVATSAMIIRVGSLERLLRTSR